MTFLLTNIFEKLNSKGKISKFIRIWQKIEEQSKKLMEKLKTQAKNSKLKEKTQGPGGFSLALPPKWVKKACIKVFYMQKITYVA